MTKGIWHTMDERIGFGQVLLYSKLQNKFWWGEGAIDDGWVIVDSIYVDKYKFDAWCYRKDLIKETGLGELRDEIKKWDNNGNE